MKINPMGYAGWRLSMVGFAPNRTHGMFAPRLWPDAIPHFSFIKPEVKYLFAVRIALTMAKHVYIAGLGFNP